MYFYGLRMRRHEPSDDAAAFGVFGTRGERFGGTWQEERGHKRDAQREFQGWLFLFSFSHLDKAFPAVFSVHWGQQQKRTRGQQTEGSRTLWEGQGKQANPKAWVFYSDHTDSGSRTRSGKGSKEQAERMWALVWPWEPVVAWGWGRNGGHIVLLYMGYGSMGRRNNSAVSTRNKSSFLSVFVVESSVLPLAVWYRYGDGLYVRTVAVLGCTVNPSVETSSSQPSAPPFHSQQQAGGI